MNGRKLALSLVVSLVLLAGSVNAETESFREIVGTTQAERITTHRWMLKYFDELESQSPRVKVIKQGVS